MPTARGTRTVTTRRISSLNVSAGACIGAAVPAGSDRGGSRATHRGRVGLVDPADTFHTLAGRAA
jgi:hypothetical protein